ncbi:MAG: double-strand break repair protein AddB [Alphaproteobacteria bacterium]|jgi:ATP-dependent helicase/nuclease subunit B|nr:double-strand break repair protein AddB [Alphaproteobacteria bacterium]MBT5390276.1 double-strand break repair protein AddB [Alphaproteobacteria bacterium]
MVLPAHANDFSALKDSTKSESTAVFASPFGAPILRTLAHNLSQTLDPITLAQTQIFLPTRRACRVLRNHFMELASDKPLFLPQIRPLGTWEEDLLFFEDADGLYPPISKSRARILLTTLLSKLSLQMTRQSPLSSSLKLSGDLLAFLVELQIEGISFQDLESLVPEDYAWHWQKVLSFLQIITQHWPQILEEEKAQDSVVRQKIFVESYKKRWVENPPEAPVIAVVSAGLRPAVTEFLTQIMELSKGQVILDGFDATLWPDTWRALTPAHPQYVFVPFLKVLKTDPSNSTHLKAYSGTSLQVSASLQELLHHVMHPEAGRDVWKNYTGNIDDALQGLKYIECSNLHEEAISIALLIREALEVPGKTISLVTPDRGLAQRVAVEMNRWDVSVDDSAGRPLSRTQLGSFLLCLSEMFLDDFSPIPFLSALKHPLMKDVPLKLIRKLERTLLRGLRPAPGLSGLFKRLENQKERFSEHDYSSLMEFLDGLSQKMDVFASCMTTGKGSVQDLLQAHMRLVESFLHTPWTNEEGEVIKPFLEGLMEDARTFPDISFHEYHVFLKSFLDAELYRMPLGDHPRISILGLMEARLQHADLVILGGLNEGVWPPAEAHDPWMTHSMREKLGLLTHQHKLGQAAFDFCQALSAKEAVMTRSLRVEGTMTLQARWITDLSIFLSYFGRELPRREDLPCLIESLDFPSRFIRTRPPAPCPPLSARPRSLSVTDIETWMRDPYSLYARHILKLRALDPIDMPLQAMDFGILIHQILDCYVRENLDPQGEETRQHLLSLGRRSFDKSFQTPGILPFWESRFERIIDWFLATEKERRSLIEKSHSEVKGEVEFKMSGGVFKLKTQADRIDHLKGGGYEILDYKTGALPTKGDLYLGYAPQLFLEGLVLLRNGFEGVSPETLHRVSYWQVRGGETPGAITSINEDVESLVEDTFERLEKLIVAFDDPKTPYQAMPVLEKAPRFSNYAHLARAKAWGLIGKGEMP